MKLRFLAAAVLAGLAIPASAAATPTPTAGANVLVDLDHGLQFPDNKQNEPDITRDPANGFLVAGANDEITNDLCHDVTTPLTSPCPFTPGEQTSLAYRSTDNGATWTGAYLPGFDTLGRVSGGDPSLAQGPQRCADHTFSYVCGTVVYYASLADPFAEFAGEQVTVSRSYDDGASWEDPVQATSTDNKSNFDDHEWVAVDDGSSSPYFGRVYVFWAVYCNTCAGNGNVKLYMSHSSDEGRTWTPAVQVSAGNNNSARGYRETGQIAVSSQGRVEAFWTENADSKQRPSLQVVATSTDGGNTFTAPITIAQVTDYPLTGTPFDAVDLFNRVPGMSARVDCYPHPATDPSSSRVYAVWCDFVGGVGVVKAAYSSDGITWHPLGTIASVADRNAFFPAVAVAPNGTVAVTFDATTAPPPDDLWSTGTQVYDNFYAESTDGGGSFSDPIQVSTESSNPDASSYNSLMEQFIGDYIGIVAGPSQAYLVWTDGRDSSVCQAVDDYRTKIYTGVKNPVAPNPDKVCAANFGNTDTEFAAVTY